MVYDFKCSEGKGFYEQVLVDQVTAGWNLDLIELGLCRLVEATQCLEEAHNLGLAENVGEHLEVRAEPGKSLEGEKSCLLVGIELEVWRDCSVHTAKDLDDFVVF